MNVLLEWKEPEPFACDPSPNLQRLRRRVKISLIKALTFWVICFALILAYVLEDLSKPNSQIAVDMVLLFGLFIVASSLTKTADYLLKPYYQKFLVVAQMGDT